MRRHLALGIFLIAAACGGPTAPPGPNGGENTLTMERDGMEESFDSIGMTLSSTEDIVRLDLTGTYNGPENVSDAGYSLQFRLELSRTELAKLTFPATLTVDGAQQYSETPNGGPLAFNYQKGPMEAPAIRSAALTMSCFCAPSGNGTQKISGTLTLQKAPGAQIYGSLAVTADGYLPGRGAASVVKIVSNFDVDINAMIVSGLTAR